MIYYLFPEWRYAKNNAVLSQGMKAIGFTKFLGDDHDGYIITSFLYPKHPNFHFNEFYERLLAKGETVRDS